VWDDINFYGSRHTKIGVHVVERGNLFANALSRRMQSLAGWPFQFTGGIFTPLQRLPKRNCVGWLGETANRLQIGQGGFQSPEQGVNNTGPRDIAKVVGNPAY
jgi:hypothetical protein